MATSPNRFIGTAIAFVAPSAVALTAMPTLTERVVEMAGNAVIGTAQAQSDLRFDPGARLDRLQRDEQTMRRMGLDQEQLRSLRQNLVPWERFPESAMVEFDRERRSLLVDGRPAPSGTYIFPHDIIATIESGRILDVFDGSPRSNGTWCMCIGPCDGSAPPSCEDQPT